jgi:hypothetical protein
VQQVVSGDRVLHHAEIGRAFEQMLALATSILRANLLAVNTLNRQTLFHTISLYVPTNMAEFCRRTLSSSFARNSTKAACTSSSGGAGKLELVVLVFGLGVGREGTALGGAEGGPVAGTGVAIVARFWRAPSGVCNGVA